MNIQFLQSHMTGSLTGLSDRAIYPVTISHLNTLETTQQVIQKKILGYISIGMNMKIEMYIDRCMVVVLIGMLITTMVIQTCSYAELTVDTDTWDDNDCNSLWNNYDTDTYNTYNTNTNFNFNGMFYNEYVRMWRNISLGLFFCVLVMIVIYAVFIRVLIINRRNEKELLTFCGKAGQYSFNMQNEFFEVSRSEYINIVGLTSNVVKATNSNMQSEHVIDQTNIYGGKFELSNQSIHVMLYKKVWWKHFKTARFRIWFWFISYIVVWAVSMKAMNRWYSTETY
eukprot:209978_1